MANHIWSSVDQPVVVKKPRTNLVILLVAVLLVAIVCAAFYLVRASSVAAQVGSVGQAAPTDVESVFESNDCNNNCLIVMDRWNTGAKYILFHYSQPECGPAILYGVDSISADGTQNRVELNKQWHDRFIEVERHDSENPCRKNLLLIPQTKVA